MGKEKEKILLCPLIRKPKMILTTKSSSPFHTR